MAGGLSGMDMIKRLRNNDNLKKMAYFRRRDPSHAANGDETAKEPRRRKQCWIAYVSAWPLIARAIAAEPGQNSYSLS